MLNVYHCKDTAAAVKLQILKNLRELLALGAQVYVHMKKSGKLEEVEAFADPFRAFAQAKKPIG